MGANGCTLDQEHDPLHAVPLGPERVHLHTALKGFEAAAFHQLRIRPRLRSGWGPEQSMWSVNDMSKPSKGVTSSGALETVPRKD
jgi:hypothetical protein